MRSKGISPIEKYQDISSTTEEGAGTPALQWQPGRSIGENKPDALPDMKGALWAASLADGITPGVGVWEKWTSVDDHVFQAMHHLTNETIKGFGDLLQVVNARYTWDKIGSDSFFNNLKGHVGEFNVLEHFHQAGVPVGMPDASNAPGTDMWVNGNPVDVKTWSDVSRLGNSHFANYPDIPAIVPHDAANIPDSALHFDPAAGFDPSHLQHSDHLVVVDHALSNADIADQTHHAINVLQDPGPAIHIPWITMAISGIREGRLLIKGHTDIARAAKNIAVDGTAVGGGGLVGAKAGILIGSVGGPIGSVIGGIIGGIAGALGGRAIANDIKRKPLMEAKDEYEKAMANYHAEETRIATYTSAEWTKAREAEQAKLQSSLDSVRAKYETHAQSVREQLKTDLTLRRGDAEIIIEAARELITNLLAESEKRFRASTSGIGRIFPGLVAPQETAQYEQLEKDILEWDNTAAFLLQNWASTPEHTVKVFDLVLVVSELEKKATEFVEAALLSRQRRFASMQGIHQGFFATVVSLRKEATDNLKSTWDGIAATAEKMLSPAIQSLRDTGESYRAELRKNGVDV